jgi:hypothetical protein
MRAVGALLIIALLFPTLLSGSVRGATLLRTATVRDDGLPANWCGIRAFRAVMFSSGNYLVATCAAERTVALRKHHTRTYTAIPLQAYRPWQPAPFRSISLLGCTMGSTVWPCAVASAAK